jgi:hypothetical protein
LMQNAIFRIHTKYFRALLTLLILFLFDVFTPLVDCLTLTCRNRYVLVWDASGGKTSSQDQKQP